MITDNFTPISAIENQSLLAYFYDTQRFDFIKCHRGKFRLKTSQLIDNNNVPAGAELDLVIFEPYQQTEKYLPIFKDEKNNFMFTNFLNHLHLIEDFSRVQENVFFSGVKCCSYYPVI